MGDGNQGSPGNSSGLSDKDHWMHQALGMSPTLFKQVPRQDNVSLTVPTTGLAPAGSDEQSQTFRAAVQQQLTAIDGHLGYVAAHAPAEKFDPLVAKRETLLATYQAALKQIDPQNPDKAKGSIDQSVSAAQGVAAEIGQARAEVEKAFNDWQTREPKYEESMQQIEEMGAWGHEKAPPLQGLLDGVTTSLDARAYAEASSAFDQFLPQVQPAYEDYQKQKAAQEKYEPARAELDPRLSAASVDKFHKLEPLQQPFEPATSAMDAAASSKDFVQALQLETDLAAKVTEFETALAELEAQKKAFDDEKAAQQPKVDQAGQAPPHPKLDPMLQDLTSEQSLRDEAEKVEDFVAGLESAKAVGAKADLYNQAVKELEEQKKAYEDVAVPLAPRIEATDGSTYKKLEAAKAEISTVKTNMEGLATSEDYVGALEQANQLSTKLQAFEDLRKDLDEKKKQYDDEMAALEPKLTQASQAPAHKKLDPMQQDLASSQTQMEQSAQDEEFDAAITQAKDLSTKADAYNTAVQELEEQKKAYEAVAAPLPPRVTNVSSSAYQKLEPAKTEIADLETKTDGSVDAEDYVAALEQANQMTSKLDAFEAARKELDEQKKAFDDEKVSQQPKIDAAKQAPLHKKLEPNVQELSALQSTMDQAEQAEDFVAALSAVKDLGAKAEAYTQAVTELEEQKTAYEAAAEPLRDRVAEASKATYKTVAPAQAEIAELQTSIEGHANDEDYVAALDQTNQLADKLTAFEQSVKQLDDQRKDFEDEKLNLQQRLDEAANSPQHQKLASMLEALTQGQGHIAELEQAEDFKGALDAAKELESQADDYLKAVADLEAQKKSFEDEFAAKVQPRIGSLDESSFKTLQPAQAEMVDLKSKIDAAAQEEDFDAAKGLVDQLSGKLDDYASKVQELTQRKNKLEQARAALQPQLDDVGKLSHPKLAPMVQDVNASVAAFDAAMQAEDYDTAEKTGDEIPAKIANYNAAVSALEPKRLAFVPLFSKAVARVEDVRSRFEKSNEPMPDQIESLRAEIEKLGLDEEYDEATTKLDDLNKQLDALELKLPDDKVGNSDEDEKKVSQSVAQVGTRVDVWLTTHRQGAADAVNQFKTQSVHDIDALVGDLSSTFDLASALISGVGGAISALFPPAGGFVLGATFLASIVMGGIKAEASDMKDAMKVQMEEFARKSLDAVSKAISAESDNTRTRLTNMAVADKAFWKMLASPMGEPEYAKVMNMLNIPDPNKNSLYGPMSKALMSEFGAWLGKEKALMGKTKEERMIAEGVPGDPSASDMRKAQQAGRATGADKGSSLARDRQQ